MSEPTMSKEDVEKLVKAFSELGQIPKADTPEDLVQWMANFSSTVKVESSVEDAVEGTTNTSDQLDVEECSGDDINENIANSADEPAVAQRRSTRRQEKPAWQTSGEFIMSQTTHEPDWMQKARYLEHLARQGIFNNTNSEVTKAFISILSSQTQ